MVDEHSSLINNVCCLQPLLKQLDGVPPLLEELWACECQLSGLGGLAMLTNLTKLQLYDAGLESLGSLTNCAVSLHSILYIYSILCLLSSHRARLSCRNDPTPCSCPPCKSSA